MGAEHSKCWQILKRLFLLLFAYFRLDVSLTLAPVLPSSTIAGGSAGAAAARLPETALKNVSNIGAYNGLSAVASVANSLLHEAVTHSTSPHLLSPTHTPLPSVVYGSAVMGGNVGSVGVTTKILSPLPNSPIGVSLSSYVVGSSTVAVSTVSQTSSGSNYLNTIKLLGPAASIDLGTSPLTHRNYPSIKGFTFRRSFDDKIITATSSAAAAVSSQSQTSLGGPAVSATSYLTHFPAIPSHYHHHHHHHLQQPVPLSPLFSHHHHSQQAHLHHVLHHPAHALHHHHLGGSGGSFHANFIGGLASSAVKYSVATGGAALYAPLTSSQSTTKLSHRDDFLQQIGYLPTTRIYSTTPSSLVDEDKAQQDFLSLSLSPPLNRRRDMPALRGPYPLKGNGGIMFSLQMQDWLIILSPVDVSSTVLLKMNEQLLVITKALNIRNCLKCSKESRADTIGSSFCIHKSLAAGLIPAALE
ncbi:hypothetical protein GQX74_004203 [Glossina fuscipes]|nr:hypothetical protein GQX74_004203 [Glossina fuscipes]